MYIAQTQIRARIRLTKVLFKYTVFYMLCIHVHNTVTKQVNTKVHEGTVQIIQSYICHVYMNIQQTQSRTRTYFFMHLHSWPVHNIVVWLLILGMPIYLWLKVYANNGFASWFQIWLVQVLITGQGCKCQKIHSSPANTVYVFPPCKVVTDCYTNVFADIYCL